MQLAPLLAIVFLVWFWVWALKKLVLEPKEKEDNRIVWNDDTSYMYRYIPSRKARKKAQAVFEGRACARGKGTSDKNVPTSINTTKTR